jgi:uncharacterized protein YbjT (DUF2867 family)
MSDTQPATRRILLAGASGLVGGLILRGLLADPQFEVIAPVRRPLDLAHPQLHPIIGQWQASTAQADLLARMQQHAALDVVICALGTTLKVAGSKAAFSAIDLDLVVGMAKLGQVCGARQAVLISSVGADPQSSNFYLSTKGQAEQALRSLQFDRLDLLRPGLLLGTRQQSRSAEAWGQRLAPIFNPLLLGPLRRYRAIAASTVAKRTVILLGARSPGVFVHEYNELCNRSE